MYLKLMSVNMLTNQLPQPSEDVRKAPSASPNSFNSGQRRRSGNQHPDHRRLRCHNDVSEKSVAFDIAAIADAGREIQSVSWTGCGAVAKGEPRFCNGFVLR